MSASALKVMEQFAFTRTNGIDTQALLIYKDNKVIYEKYASGLDGTSSLRVHSLGQLLIHLAAGHGIKQGIFREDVKLSDAFQSLPDNFNKDIRLLDLMRLSSGLRYYYDREANERLNDVFKNKSSEKTDLQKKFPEFLAVSVYPPGTRFNFGFIDRNLTIYLLNELFKKPTLDQFLEETVIKRLGLSSTFYRFNYPVESNDHYPVIDYSAMGVRSSTYDILKILRIYLEEGSLDGIDYFDRDWPIKSWATIESQADFKEKKPGNQTDAFGTFWFLNKPHPGHGKKFLENLPDDLVMIRGHKGQFLALIPSQKFILIRIGNDSFTSPRVGGRILELLSNELTSQR